MLSKISDISNMIIVVCASLTAILTIIEKSQTIKYKPISKLLHGDLEQKIDNVSKEQKELKDSIEKIQKTVDYNDIDVVRNRIIANEQLLNNGAKFERHQWESLYKDINKWNLYHEKYPDLNGIIKVAIENIDKHYMNR